MKRALFLHPYIFAASSAIILYVSMPKANRLISPLDVFIPTLLATAICLVLAFIAFLLTRESKSAAMIATLFVLGLLHLWYIFIAVICIVLLGILLVWMVLKRVRFEDVNMILSIISIFVFGYYLYRFLDLASNQPSWKALSNVTHPVMAVQKVTASPDQFPDIYYIILDGYGRADMLETLHGYNDSTFITALEQRGFVVTPKSQSNYPHTLISLSSSLNMQYLDTFTDTMGSSTLWWPAGDAIQHSWVRSFLEQEGYQTVFITSGFDLTDIRDGDVYLKPYPIMLRNFQMAFFSWTNLRFLGNSWSGVSFPSNNENRRIILYAFDILPDTAKLPGPKFVFSHIVAPHPPYLFNSVGEPVDQVLSHPEVGTPGYSENILQFRQAYLDQLTFINQKTLKMIDGILARSKTPPVIILQGDHGPDVFMDINDPGKACLYERYSILNAYYLPNVPAEAIPADISPVNSFRFIFNRYFGTNLEMLANRRYFSPDTHFYQFQDVTNQTESKCNLPPGTSP